MKFKKRILSLLVAVMILINCSPLSYATDNSVLIVGDLYDAITDIEYGWDGTTYRFPDDALQGVDDGDDVYLVADPGTVDDLTLGAKFNLQLSDFRIEGTDADKYTCSSDLSTMFIEKEVEIIRKKVVIAPYHPYIYYGQNGPSNNKIEELDDYKDQIINDDINEIKATFKIKNLKYKVVGDYKMELDDDIIVKGDAVDNYNVKCAENLIFSVKEYNPDVKAIVENDPDKFVGVNKATLYAPENYLISKDSSFSNWYDEITIELDDTDDGKFTYYLRNNDKSDTEHYKAISTAKTFQYKSIQKKPQVKAIKIEKVDTNAVLNFLTFGVFGNGKLAAKVTVEVGRYPLDTTIFLGENGEYRSIDVTADDGQIEDETPSSEVTPPEQIPSSEVTPSEEEIPSSEVISSEIAAAEVTPVEEMSSEVPTSEVSPSEETPTEETPEEDTPTEVVTADVTLVDGIYFYTATFELDVEEEQSVTKQLTAYAKNDCGKGTVYPPKKSEDKFEGTTVTNVQKPVTIDKKKPEVEITKINGNYNKNSVRAKFTVSDPGSGVAKIEYLWDDGFYLNKTDKKNSKLQTDYVELKLNSDADDVDYEIVTKWDLLEVVKYNRHSLRLKVTDNAGNVYESGRVYDTTGSDMFEPNIESVEIRKTVDDTNNDSFDVKYYPFGTFYNQPVEIVIKANDNEATEGYFATGVGSVKVNDIDAQQVEETNEYVLRVEPDFAIKNMVITVTDKNNLSTELSATDVLEHGLLQSNELFIEKTAPEISFGDIKSKGHKDKNKNIWFGQKEVDEELAITIKDDDSSVNSGLYSVVIKDNGEEVSSNSNFDSIECEYTKSFRIGDLSDGHHNFVVEVYDNCGNKATDEITFYKDTMLPEKGVISADSPNGKKVIDSEQWFEGKDDITFRVETPDAKNSIKNISLKINKKSFNYDNLKEDDVISEENGKCYVEAITTDVKHDEKQCYTIKGTITDLAGNTVELDPMTVYKDFDIPVIEKITVEKKSDALDKVLKVLTFGVYSNDVLIVKAYTKDSDFDSGIDFAKLSYTGLLEPEKMTALGDGVFSFELPFSNKFFESSIDIKVYDKFGKVNVDSPQISNVEGSATSDINYVMIENDKPTITPNLPKGDGLSRKDNQIWYAYNKEITFKFEDIESGLNNIDFTINGVIVKEDKNGDDLLESKVAEKKTSRIFDVVYTFDTDYFTEICGEAEDGEYEINAIVTDNAGNIRSCTRTYYLDKTSPVIQSIDFVPKTADGKSSTSEFVKEFEYGYYFKTDFNITVNVSDEGPSSGLHEVRYRFVSYENGKKRNQITGSQDIVNGKAELSVPKGFKGQIFVEAFDYVGNASGKKTTKAYVVDNAAPAIKITNNADTDYRDADGNSLYVKTNKFTVVITDTVSGIWEIGYLQKAEKNPYDRKIIDIANIANVKHELKSDLGDGWIVTGVDANLVTQVTKVFTFPKDDNDVMLAFDATDNSRNKCRTVKSERFTLDKTAPVINVDFRNDDDTDLYYNRNRIADITVIERNFDESLIKVAIENTFGDVPAYSFKEESKDKHIAVINFDEGDYTFNLKGKDLGDHVAKVNFSGGNEKLFYVDKTKPTIKENFSELTNSSENSFNVDKTVNIRIVEHNFSPELMNLKIFRNVPGSEHTFGGLEDVTTEVLGISDWNSEGDVHTISFTFDNDAVYCVEIEPTDLATNVTEKRRSQVFEIDKTVPVVSMKNGSAVSMDDTKFIDVYPLERKDDDVPTVEFEDFNISYIKYKLSVFLPEHSKNKEVVVNHKSSDGVVDGNKYTLPEFKEDGIYAVELTAVDVAGNKSKLNLNTYARMVNQEVLAFIMDSNLKNKTGLYSFEYKNGQPISKKPSSFEDLKICVMAKEDTTVDIVMRDTNGKEINTNSQFTTNDKIYGIGICNYQLKSDFFRENFQEDIDVELILSVKNEGRRIDLGKMHIDNIAPTCKLPDELESWHWMYGDKTRKFIISDISELLDESQCKIYDNGKVIPFVYSEDDNTITFTLSDGWHNVGFVLADMAGNANNIQEKTNIHIGYFWLWIIIAVAVLTIISIVCVVIYNINRKKRDFEEF